MFIIMSGKDFIKQLDSANFLSVSKICRICLTKDVKMYGYNEFMLKECYEDIIGQKVTLGLPHHFCYMCAAMLIKFYKFKKKCQTMEQIMVRKLFKGPITFDTIIEIAKQTKKIQSNFNIVQANDKVKTFYTINNSYESSDEEEHLSEKDEPVEITKEMEAENGNDDAINYRNLTDNMIEVEDEQILDTQNEKINTDVQPISIDKEKVTVSIEKLNKEKDRCINKEGQEGSASLPIEIKMYVAKCTTSTLLPPEPSVKIQVESNLERANALSESENCNDLNVNENSGREVVKEILNEDTKNETENNQEVICTEEVNTFCKNKGDGLNPDCWLKTNMSEIDAFEAYSARARDSEYMIAPFKCNLCYEGFWHNDHLIKHTAQWHDESIGLHECRYCKYRFKHMQSLLEHWDGHYYKYSCLRCEYVSFYEPAARVHNDSHETFHQCKPCELSFSNRLEYYNHMEQIHKRHICTKCGAMFAHALGFQTHQHACHFGKNIMMYQYSKGTGQLELMSIKKNYVQLEMDKKKKSEHPDFSSNSTNSKNVDSSTIERGVTEDNNTEQTNQSSSSIKSTDSKNIHNSELNTATGDDIDLDDDSKPLISTIIPKTLDETTDEGNNLEVAGESHGTEALLTKKIRISKQERIINYKKLIKERRKKIMQKKCPMKPGCDDKCRKKCQLTFSEENRKAIYNSYWSMSLQEQRHFIKNNVTIVKPLKRRGKDKIYRSMTITYYLSKESGEKVPVCKIFFLETLGYCKYNRSYIAAAMNNAGIIPSIHLPSSRRRNKLKIFKGSSNASNKISLPLNCPTSDSTHCENVDISIVKHEITGHDSNEETNQQNSKLTDSEIVDSSIIKQRVTGCDTDGDFDSDDSTKPLISIAKSRSLKMMDECSDEVADESRGKRKTRKRRLIKKEGAKKRQKLYNTHEERVNAKRNSRIQKKLYTLKPGCDDTCRKKCKFYISEEQRKSINNLFWSMNAHDQKYFIISNTAIVKPLRSKKFGVYREEGRSKTVIYFLSDELEKKISVCKKFFLGTLGYFKSNDRLIRDALSDVVFTV